jgi:Domain of unknown function (DUF892)
MSPRPSISRPPASLHNRGPHSFFDDPPKPRRPLSIPPRRRRRGRCEDLVGDRAKSREACRHMGLHIIDISIGPPSVSLLDPGAGFPSSPGSRGGRRARRGVAADLSLIAAAQRVEHYEASGYSSARTLAQQLRNPVIVQLLSASLAEEENADQLLNQLAQSLMSAAKMPAAVE